MHGPYFQVMTGTGTFESYVNVGSGIPATPDGRLTGQPTASDISPQPFPQVRYASVMMYSGDICVRCESSLGHTKLIFCFWSYKLLKNDQATRLFILFFILLKKQTLISVKTEQARYKLWKTNTETVST